MTKRLVIIDGKSVFYRGYYAMPNLSTKDGTPTGGVYGFAMMALEVIRRLKPDYVCVAWDKRGTSTNARLKLYPQYKGNRKAPPPDFYEQIPILHQLLESLDWPLYEIDDYEADDIMAAFAKQAGEQGIESFLVTSDLDMLQLVNEHTHIYTLKKGLSNIELFDVAHFEEKYGVGAHQWIDVKALKGDASDNIPGVAGIGPTIATELISRYKTLDGVYENIELLKPAVKAKLEKDKDMAYLSKKLVTLETDLPLKIDLNHAKLQDGVRPEFVATLRKLEFRALLRQVETQVPADVLAEAEVEEARVPAAENVPFSLDQFQPDTPRVAALSSDAQAVWVSTKADQYASIPLSELDKKTVSQLANGPVVGHDLKTLFRALLQNDLAWPGEVGHDTRIAAFVLNSLIRSHSLEDILERGVDPDNPGETIAGIWEAYKAQKLEFDEVPTLLKVAQRLDFPTIRLLATIEHRGITLDKGYLHTMSQEFEGKIQEIEQQVYKLAGEQFNISSPAQLGTILFDTLGLPTAGVKKGKTGYSTGAAELAKLRDLHPIVDLITQYREYTKLKNTYVDVLPKLTDERSRVHTTFALDVAATGRLSSHDPNLQNIPTRTDMGQAIRRAFVPAPGNVFVSADYSQFELRLAAVMAHDQEMIDDFNNGVDIHTKTAAEVAGIPTDQVDKNLRRNAKVVNFGILYGMSPHGLSIATTMTRDEAKNFIDKYFALRPKIREYMDRTVDKALQGGYVETIFGRRRPTPDLRSSNFAVREAAKRAAINMPIQGTEADLMKMAMLKVEKVLNGKGLQLLQVHDSILVECHQANADEVAKLLKETMETIYTDLPITLQVDVSTGQTWADL
jgi:DNA polymerase I